jgi:hypothetical protein
MLMRDSIPYPNSFRLQWHFLEVMWMLITPHPTISIVHVAGNVKPFFRSKEYIIQYIQYIFPNECTEPLMIM